MDARNEQLHANGESSGTLSRGKGHSIAYRRRNGKPGLPGVVFLGGFRSDMTGTKAAALDAFCARRDQAYLRFDYQGHGASSGRFEDGTIGQWRDDSLAALDELTEGPQILVGSSMGGWMALLAGIARPHRVAGLVLIAGAVDFTQMLIWDRLGGEAQARLLAEGRLRVESDYEPGGFHITRRLIEDGQEYSLLGRAVPFDRPVRLLHGMRDRDVPWLHSVRIAEFLAGTDVRLTLVKDGDHRLSTPSNLDLLTGSVAELSGAAA